MKYGFTNEKRRRIHIEKHLHEYPGFTEEQYIAHAMELIQKPTGNGILGHIDKDGIITRYDVRTNDYVKGRPDRGIYTMYKPVDGKAYYDRMYKGDLEHGGLDEMPSMRSI